MIGFVYLWRDRYRRMYYLGSHLGTEDDGYICSSGSWFKNAYRKRPEDFRRRIIERIYDGGIPAIRAAENRWLKLIKQDELGTRYYNLKIAATGFDSYTARRAGQLAASRLTAEEKTAKGKLGGKATAAKIDEYGNKFLSLAGKKGGYASRSDKNEHGKSIMAIECGLRRSGKGYRWWTTIDGVSYQSILPRNPDDKIGRIVNNKNGYLWWTTEDGKSYRADLPRNPLDRRGMAKMNCDSKKRHASGKKAAHVRLHLMRGVVNEGCEFCQKL